MAKSIYNRKRHKKRRRVSKYVNRKLIRNKSGGDFIDKLLFKIDNINYTIERKQSIFPITTSYRLVYEQLLYSKFIETKEAFIIDLFLKHYNVYVYLKENINNDDFWKSSKSEDSMRKFNGLKGYILGLTDVSTSVDLKFTIKEDVEYSIRCDERSIKINADTTTSLAKLRFYSLNNMSNIAILINPTHSLEDFVRELSTKFVNVFMVAKYLKATWHQDVCFNYLRDAIKLDSNCVSDKLIDIRNQEGSDKYTFNINSYKDVKPTRRDGIYIYFLKSPKSAEYDQCFIVSINVKDNICI